MVLPDNIVIAARDGDLSTVRTWLESDATHDINDVAGADLPGDDVWSVKGRGLLRSRPCATGGRKVLAMIMEGCAVRATW